MTRRITSGLIGSRAFLPAISLAVIVHFFNLMQTASGQPCNTTPPVTDPGSGRIEGLVVNTGQGSRSRNATVATDFEGKFIVAYEIGSQAPLTPNDLFVQRFNADGTCFCGVNDECPTRVNDDAPPTGERHLHPSIAMNRLDMPTGSEFHLAFLIDPVNPSTPSRANVRTWTEFFEVAPFVSPAIQHFANPLDEGLPSAGNGLAIQARSWTRGEEVPVDGLLYQADGSLLTQIEACGNLNTCVTIFTPCLWMRENGDFVIAWADIENFPVMIPRSHVRRWCGWICDAVRDGIPAGKGARMDSRTSGGHAPAWNKEASDSLG